MLTNENVEKLLKDSLQMLNIVKNLEMSQETEEQLCSVCMLSLKKLAVAQMLYGRHIIAVSGEQGAGKSTMIMNMYGLDDDVLPICEGRGEKIPVVISEHQGPNTEYLVHILRYNDEKKQHELTNEVITKEDFAKKSQFPDDNIIYLEMIVPEKYFENSSNSSFMLLPGFEKNEKIPEYWQSVIDFSLACSDSCIMVYQSSMLAGKAIGASVERLKEIFGDAKPIFAISHSEDLSDIQKEEIIMNSLTTFSVTNEEKDRFVFIYNQSALENEKWIKELCNCCSIYLNSSFHSRKHQSEYLLSIIQNELSKNYQKIRYSLRNIATANGHVLDNHPLLKAFDNEKNRKRKEFNRYLKNEMASARKNSFDDLDKKYLSGDSDEDTKNSFKRFGENAKKIFLGAGAKDAIKSEKLIAETMKDKKERSRIAVAFSNSLVQMSGYVKKTIEEDIMKNVDDESDILPPNQEKVDKKANELQMVLDSVSIVQNKMETLQTNDLKQLSLVIHSLAAYIFAGQVNEAIEQNIGKLSDMNTDNKNNSFDFGSFKEASVNSTKFYTGVLALFGIDFIPDQKLNLPQQLATVFGISEGIMTGLFGAVSLAFLAQSTVKNLNRAELKQFYSYRTMIGNNYKDALEVCLEQYDIYMDSIRAKLVSYVERILGCGKREMLLMNANILLSRVEDNLNELQGEIVDSRESVPLLYR